MGNSPLLSALGRADSCALWQLVQLVHQLRAVIREELQEGEAGGCMRRITELLRERLLKTDQILHTQMRLYEGENRAMLTSVYAEPSPAATA